MILSPFKITPSLHDTQQLQVKLPAALYSKIASSDNITLSFGKKRVPVFFEKGHAALEINAAVAEALSLPFEVSTLRIGYNATTHTLTIGPVFAVLVTMQKASVEEPFGPHSLFFQEMATYCEQNDIFFYVFPIQKVSGLHVRGYRWEQSNWEERTLPLPDVFYNRVSSRKLEKKVTAERLFAYCREHQVKYFNEQFLNKWEVYRTLRNHPEITPYLPETVLYKKASDLDKMLQKHSTLFIKPISGSLGRRITRIQHKNGKYSVNQSNFWSEENNKSSLLALLRLVLPRIKKEHFIIQQGIELISLHHRPIDFRVLCIKDRFGIWKARSIVARISAEKRFVSNVAMGGQLKKPQEMLRLFFNRHDSIGLHKLLIDLSLQCATIIEQNQHGYYGEFGVDLAVDEAGKPWILEMNTKPSKSDDGTLHTNKSIIRPSVKALVDCAIFFSSYELT